MRPEQLEPRSRFRRPGSPLVWAHRGASAHAPENTALAFELAALAGADGVELDVRLAACGTVVVAHDPTLERVARRPSAIAALDARALRDVELLGASGSTRGVPTLDDTIDQLAPRGLRVNVELKGDVPDRLALCRRVGALLARRRASERAGLLLSSFRPEMLLVMRALARDVPTAFLFDEENTGLVRAAVLLWALRPDGAHPSHRLASRASIAAWHRQGYFVSAWTVDDETRIAALDADGVDGVISNDPARARAALRP